MSVTDLLIPDDCGRRAFDETIADWREERAKGESVFARVSVDLRASAGILRVFAMTTADGLVRPDAWRCLAWTLVAAAALAAVQITVTALLRAQLSLYGSFLSIMLLPAGMAVYGSLAAAFGVGLVSGRRMPGLALAVLLAAMTATLVGYVVPAANQYFREQWVVSAGSNPAIVAERGVPEQSAAELLRRAMSNQADAARQEFLRRLVLTVAAPVMFLLGGALRARLGVRFGWRVSQIAGGVASVAIFAGGCALGAWLGHVFRDSWHSFFGGYWSTLPFWFGIAVSLLLTFLLARRTPAES